MTSGHLLRGVFDSVLKEAGWLLFKEMSQRHLYFVIVIEFFFVQKVLHGPKEIVI